MLKTLELVHDIIINDNDNTDPTGVLAMLEQQDMFAKEDAIEIILRCMPKTLLNE